MILEHFHISSLEIDNKIRQNAVKIKNLNISNQFDLIYIQVDIQYILHLYNITAKNLVNKFFSSLHRIFTNINQILDHKIHLNKVKMTEFIQIMFSITELN